MQDSELEKATGPVGHLDLAGYQNAKSELAGIVRFLLELARERKDDQTIRRLKALLARLVEDRFNLAVLGRFNRGKSSLMNAILGMDRLPTGIVPITSVVTTVRYGSKERVLIQREGWPSPQEISLESLPDYITEIGNPGNRKRVTVAEIQLPAEVLRHGFYFIDTPGIGSGIEENTSATERFLPEADAAIFVLSFESPLDRTELAFLERLCRSAAKVFLVINKADLAAPEDRSQFPPFVAEQLRSLGDTGQLSLFPLSARDALRAKMVGDEAALARSGLPNLEAKLIDFLTSGKMQSFLLRIAAQVQEFVEREQVETEFERHLRENPQRAADLLETFHRRLQEVAQEKDKVLEQLREHVAASLGEIAEPELIGWRPGAESALYEQLTNDISAMGAFERFEALQDRMDSIGPQCRELASSWLAAKWPAISKRVQGLVNLGVYDLRQLLVKDEKIGAEISNSDSALPDSEARWIGRLESHTPAAPKFVWLLPWWTGLLLSLPLAPVRRWAARRIRNNLRAALDAYAENLRAGISVAGEQWVDELGRGFDREASEIESHFEQLWRSPAGDNQVNALQELKTRVESLWARVADARSGTAARKIPARYAPAQPLSNGHHPEKAEACRLCAAIVEASFEFLRKFQYQLVKNPAEQDAHAERGGFCSFHTWLYESMSSPHGICAAYAPVLSRLSERLLQLADSQADSLKTSNELQRILPGSETCPVCLNAKAVEAREIDEFLSKDLNSESIRRSSHWLCLIHLQALLHRGAPPNSVRELLLNHAAVLQRTAEDMQQFALKHDALRRYLMTDEEREAYQRALQSIVGARALSFVRTVTELV